MADTEPESQSKIGAELLLETAQRCGIEVCFANPGTTELELVDALRTTPGIRPVLGLFEGVCSGAADGYARMANKPALTVTHLGPGFANAIANLHNARRANSPVVNIIGDHATWHLDIDAPLTSDIESLAQPVSKWVRRCKDASKLGEDMAAAIEIATAAPSGVATLIVPQDLAWAEVAGTKPATASCVTRQLVPVAHDARSAAITALQKPNSALLLDHDALSVGGQNAAAAIAEATGALLLHATLPALMARGNNVQAPTRLPYLARQARSLLSDVRSIVLAGAREPHSFFGYKDQPSKHLEDAEIVILGGESHDLTAALTEMCDTLGVQAHSPRIIDQLDLPTGLLDPQTMGETLAALQPANTILVDEAATSGGPAFEGAKDSPPHDWLGLTGGAIGMGLPVAIGAAIACPHRQVIAFEGDGSSLYTIQSLWTMVREQLNIIVIICNNQSYRIIQGELYKAGLDPQSFSAKKLTSLNNPVIDFAAVAEGFGLAATRVSSAEEFSLALTEALDGSGPRLIDAVLS